MAKDKVIWLPRGWQPVHVGYCPSEKAWRREVRKLGYKGLPYPNTDAAVSFFERSEQANNCAVVTMNSKDQDPVAIIGILSHEATHVWQFCCQVMGEDKAGQEIEAYSIQAILQELIYAYERSSGNVLAFQ